MKLSKSLLGAILIGITLQTTTSCKKEKESPGAKTEAQKKEEEKAKNSDPCPACGMG
jgi:hypothetical protein